MYGCRPTTALIFSESLSALSCAVSDHSTAIVNEKDTHRCERNTDDVRNTKAHETDDA